MFKIYIFYIIYTDYLSFLLNINKQGQKNSTSDSTTAGEEKLSHLDKCKIIFCHFSVFSYKALMMTYPQQLKICLSRQQKKSFLPKFNPSLLNTNVHVNTQHKLHFQLKSQLLYLYLFMISTEITFILVWISP